VRLFAAFYTLDVSEIESSCLPLAAREQKYLVLNRRQFCGTPFILDQRHSRIFDFTFFCTCLGCRSKIHRGCRWLGEVRAKIKTLTAGPLFSIFRGRDLVLLRGKEMRA